MTEVGAVPELLRRFVVRFDGSDYWLAHEELEELWLADRRDLYKALIHLAAAMVHVERRNWRGALTKGSSCHRLLSQEDDTGVPLDSRALRQEVLRLVGELERLAEAPEDGFNETRRIRLSPLFSAGFDDSPLDSEEVPYRVRRHEAGYRIGRDPKLRD